MIGRGGSIALLVACAAARADQVVMLNGDRLSGRIRSLDDGKLFMSADMAGAVTLPWSNIRSIVSTQPLYVLLEDGRVLTGTIVNAKSGMRLQDSNSSEIVPRDSIVRLRSFEEQFRHQRAEERKLSPHLLDPWTGFVDAGVSLARGNADVTTYSVNGNGARTRPANKVSLYFNSLYSRNKTKPPAATTADVRRGGGRIEFNMGPRQFAFVSADLEFDRLQLLDLRSVGGAGFGRHMARTPRNTFDLFAGATANREAFATGLTRVSAETLFSEESSHRLNSLLTFKQKVSLFPNLTQRGEYRLAVDSSAVTNLMRWLSWQVSVSNRYLSDPVPGAVTSDVLLTTGIRFHLPSSK